MTSKLLFVPALVAALLVFSGAAAAETTSSFELRFTDLTHGELRLVQTWEGKEASDFRKSLDNSLGNRDGNLNETEVDRIMRATKADFQGAWHPRLQMNGEYGHITEATIDQEGLAGNTSGTGRISLTHNLRIEWNSTNTTSPKFNTTIGVGPYAKTGNVTIHAPPGWTIESAEGFVDDPNPGDSVSGKAEFDENIEVTFKEGAQNVGGNGRTPGPGLLAVVGAAVAVGLLARRKLH
ncbi:MAG TPA: hypothetical protein VNZ52_06930 [Candidatus Thermoplasmatota archaeon]|nr:hypothetical protein [Candidatus Thermoplasmatota archaeon]